MGDGSVITNALKQLPFQYADNSAEHIRNILHTLENLHFENYLDEIAKQYNTSISIVENALKAFNGVDKKLEQKLRTGFTDIKQITGDSTLHACTKADAIQYFIGFESHGNALL